MTINHASTIGQIVLEHPECASVFRDHRIDFCCRGERSLTAACAEKELEVGVVAADLDRAIADRQGRHEPGNEVDPRAMSTADLISFIVSRHHAYTDKALGFLEPLAAKVARVHGDKNPDLVKLHEDVRTLAATLEPHMREEERVLFPALVATSRDQRLVAAELASMQADHLEVGTLLTRLRAHAADFQAPSWACGSYRTLMSELGDLELDVLRHVHLETHGLAPRFANAARAQGTGAAEIAT